MRNIVSLGDAGGPIMEWNEDHWNQVGIVSYTPFGCLTPNHQPIYTRLAAYYNWMQSILQKTNHTLSNAEPRPPPPPPPTVYRCNQNTVQCGCGLNSVVLSLGRIVGGHEAVPNSWPMIVSILSVNSTSHSCGGSILNDNYILTAAHCVDNYLADSVVGLSIAAGIHDRSEVDQTIRQVDRIILHPGWNQSGNNRHDIAILHLSQPLNISSNKKLYPTCVPHVNTAQQILQYPPNGTQLVVIGWGDTGHGAPTLPSQLQQVEVFNIDNNDPICVESIDDSQFQFCAGLHGGGKGEIIEQCAFCRNLIICSPRFRFLPR